MSHSVIGATTRRHFTLPWSITAISDSRTTHAT